MRGTIGTCALVAALVVAGCGSDDAAESAPTSTAAAPIATAPATTEPTRTTIPLVTVPEGNNTPRAGSSTTAPTNATRPAAQNPEQGEQPHGAPPDNPNPADPGDPSEPAPTLPPSGIPELDDVLGGQPVIEPPDGAGTAMRATITPVDDLAVGDLVTIEAENAPPGQLMAYGQCTGAVADTFEVGLLLESCGSFGIGEVEPDGTVGVTVRVLARVGGVDCRAETCVVGLIVFPGTEGLRVYEPITLAG